MFLGLRTVIYPAPDLPASKVWFNRLLDLEPYFDEDFYVGYSVQGYELALDPHADPAAGPVTYWGVADADAAHATLVSAGATAQGPVADVGDGIRTATFLLPHSSGRLGIIENPHFVLAESGAGDGPGR